MYVVAVNGESQKWQWKQGYLIWEEKAYSGFMMTQNGFVQFYAFITSFRNSNILDNQ